MDKYIGKRLDGRYEIREVIGIGGMAYVYKAYDSIDDRTVAVKILKDEFLNNQEFTRRFKNESKAIAILSHPNIVKVYDVNFSENLQYIVMEYIDGITLKEYMDQQHDIRWKEAVHFTLQILRALQHAHDKGIVHRDIKPQNIMLLADGTIKVTDFGIARFSRQDIRATSEDKAIGSVHYISPEQARGEITDEKADIYSVGVMLYEMLTGRLPFDADNAVSVAIMQLQSTPTPPREVNPDIPEGLEDITTKAMQKEPADRYQSAAEMLCDIDEFKRNPSIHFEYKYFVDETPTRFVEAITKVKGEPEMPDDEEDEEEKKSIFLPILAAVAGAVILISLIFVGVVFLGKFLGPTDSSAEEVKVASFIGANVNDIIHNEMYLEKYEFDEVVEMYDDSPAGTIIKQNPGEGRVEKVKCSVKLWVSKGPNMIEVPRIAVGQETAEDAKTKLTKAGFKANEILQSDDTVPEGVVIKVQPGYPNSAKAGSTINLYVSNGPRPVDPVKVPALVGTDLAVAENLLLTSQLVMVQENIIYKNEPGAVKGQVIGQSVAPETLVQPGTEIILTVASGYSDVRVTVPLPNEDLAVDLMVYINNRASAAPEYGEPLKGLYASGMGSLPLTFSEQLPQYTVAIFIRESGVNAPYEPYLEYTINGADGTVVLDKAHPFGGGGATSSSATAGSTDTQTDPSASVTDPSTSTSSTEATTSSSEGVTTTTVTP